MDQLPVGVNQTVSEAQHGQKTQKEDVINDSSELGSTEILK